LCVFTDKDREEELKQAGVEYVGNDEVIKQITENRIEFDRLIATQE
jgi:ribosomal protein L1